MKKEQMVWKKDKVYFNKGKASDVEIVAEIVHDRRYLTCKKCAMNEGRDFHLNSYFVTQVHLGFHRGAGHKVPDDGLEDVLDDLIQERERKRTHWKNFVNG